MPDRRPDPDVHRDHGPAHPGMPRWVKVFVIIGAALLGLLIATQFIGDGGHGPGRHGGGGDQTPASTDDSGHRPPVDHGP